MFTQPAPSSPTLATTTSPVPPASPQRPSRLRGLSYLRNYTHNHLHARDSNNETPTSSRRYSLTRAISYPSPNLSQSGPTSPSLQSPIQRPTDNESAGNKEPGGSTSGCLPSATQPGNDSDHTSLLATMGRTRSATTGRAAGSDISQINGVTEPELQFGSALAQPGNGVKGADNVNQLPSIRFSQHQDVRAPRPSLVFSPMGRTLPTGRETIRVGRYSERENQPNPASNVPSAAPIGFKSKVVSRRHCEFWYEGGQWYIKDVKSSSGTFLNHVRLSSPGTESKPFPVKDGDIVQLGIDFKGGEEMIFRCVKIRVELNRGWQSALNSFKYVASSVFAADTGI
jgi:pSer/pThr/pTyr-binding forkhead associated (FHA) protein